MIEKVMEHYSDVLPELSDDIKFGRTYTTFTISNIIEHISSLFKGYDITYYELYEIPNWVEMGTSSQPYEMILKSKDEDLKIRFYIPVIEPYNFYNDMILSTTRKYPALSITNGLNIMLITLNVKITFKPFVSAMFVYGEDDIIYSTIHLFNLYGNLNIKLPIDIFNLSNDYHIFEYDKPEELKFAKYYYTTVDNAGNGVKKIVIGCATPEKAAALFYVLRFIDISHLKYNMTTIIGMLTYTKIVDGKPTLTKSLQEIYNISSKGLYDVIDKITAAEIGCDTLAGVADIIDEGVVLNNTVRYNSLYFILYGILYSINKNNKRMKYISRAVLYGLNKNITSEYVSDSVRNNNNIAQIFTLLCVDQHDGNGVQKKQSSSYTNHAVTKASDIVDTGLLSAKKALPTNGALNLFTRFNEDDTVFLTEEDKKIIGYLDRLL